MCIDILIWNCTQQQDISSSIVPKYSQIEYSHISNEHAMIAMSESIKIKVIWNDLENEVKFYFYFGTVVVMATKWRSQKTWFLLSRSRLLGRRKKTYSTATFSILLFIKKIEDGFRKRFENWVTSFIISSTQWHPV